MIETPFSTISMSVDFQSPANGSLTETSNGCGHLEEEAFGDIEGFPGGGH